MNVVLIYEDAIRTFDTRADNLALATEAQLEVEVDPDGRASRLHLWANLRSDDDYRTQMPPDEALEVLQNGRGYPTLVSIIKESDLGQGEDLPRDLISFFEMMGAKFGLLRCDVNGETFYQAAPPAVEGGAEDLPDDALGDEQPW